MRNIDRSLNNNDQNSQEYESLQFPGIRDHSAGLI